MSAFKEAQIEQLVSSGWSTCDRIAGLVQERGLPRSNLTEASGAPGQPLR